MALPGLWEEEDQGEDLEAVRLCVFALDLAGSPLLTQRGDWTQFGASCPLPSTIATFYLGCISDHKSRKRKAVNCSMVIVVIYLILLTTGAGLLVVKGKEVWVLPGASRADTGLRLK